MGRIRIKLPPGKERYHPTPFPHSGTCLKSRAGRFHMESSICLSDPPDPSELSYIPAHPWLLDPGAQTILSVQTQTQSYDCDPVVTILLSLTGCPVRLSSS